MLDSSAMTFSSNGLRLIVVVGGISLTRRKGCGDDGDKATSDSDDDDDDREDDNDTSLDFMVDTTSLIRCSCTLCVPGENASDGAEERRRVRRDRGRKSCCWDEDAQ